MTRSIFAAALVASAGLATSAVAQADAPHAGMLRYPDVSATEIVFVYANDLWVVSRDGGQARPLASPAGQEMFPKFSPDGSRVVFQGNYDGDRDLYSMPTTGGLPTRLTHRPGPEMPTDWTTGDDIAFFTFADRDGITSPRMYAVDSEGGMPTKMPIEYGANGVVSDDGVWLAYTPFWRDSRTWKRYQGGMAADVWLFNLETNESRQITDWAGTDTMPMWNGSTVYYLSDAGDEHRLNIWAFDTTTNERRQVTGFEDFDVKFPSIGPGPDGRGEIVFQLGDELRLVDLANGESRAIRVTVPGARPALRPRAVDAGTNLSGGGISSTGKRAVVEARGDIWTLPAENGPIRQLTDTSGAAERSPAWSPDGRWIAYFSDEDGEYELYLTQSDGKGETRQLTDGNETFFFSITWSPDSASLVVTDKAGRLLLVDAETGDTTEFDRDPWGNQPEVSWSGDSRWITWSRAEERTLNSSIWVYDTDNAEKHKLTSGFFSDASPVFSRDGEYLYYTSSRRFENPQYEDVGSTFVYANTGVLIAVPLTEEVENPWLIESDEETWQEEDAADEAEGDDEAAEDEAAEDDEAAEEDAEDADGEADAPDESDPTEGLDTEHPLFGEWEGVAKGFKALGMPEDELSFSMVIVVDDEGNISGTSESSGETSDLGDVVTWDEGTGEFYRERAQNGIVVASRGTVNGDTMSGTWEIEAMGVSGTWEATRSTRTIDEETLAEILDAEGGEEGKPVEITIDGFEERGMELPVPVGRFSTLAVNDKNQLLYVRSGSQVTPPAIKLLDISDDEPEEKTVLGGAGGFDLSGDGKKLIAGGAGGWAIVDAKPGQNFSSTLPTSGMRKIIEPREEWKQIFTDAWRRHRDFFYVENMHGVDWDAVYERYNAMLDDAATREDVSFIIGEMISELNVGHAYYWGGDVEGQPSENVGLLGADFELGAETDDAGNQVTAYRFARIYEGGAWDSDARGPLSQPGVDVNQGTYLLKVNGITVDTARDPWAAFIGLVGKDTTLTVADALVGDDEARTEREITIKPMASEADLRYRAWVENNRRYVEKASSGRVGYIHVPNTGVQGQNELFRQFYGQTGMDALIIDERWNGGGQIPNRFIELLNRPRTNYWARRDGRDWPWPYDSHQGPKCMLINGMAGSGGDMFPWLFKHHDIGKLVGARTWGGLVGISGVPGLIDGGYTAVPTFGFYEIDGTWGIEGHGVDPDIAVVDDPSLRAAGSDPQLDAAIELMLQEADANPYRPATRPGDPDRSGMGITDEDR